jgi:hypothetical protein
VGRAVGREGGREGGRAVGRVPLAKTTDTVLTVLTVANY